MMTAFSEFHVKNLQLRNRIVMPPMCMYSSDDSGMVQDFHRVHYTTRAVGGVGLIIQEATAVSKNGRISSNDLGIWNDAQTKGLAEIASSIQSYGAAAGIQLAHAGRKCESQTDTPVAPSAIAFNEEYRVPEALSVEEIQRVVKSFGEAAGRALTAGYDLIELHGAHGYLIHEFLSPLSNHRTDAYGGPLKNRVRFLKEVLTAVRSAWPVEKPLGLRLSASDYLEGGLDIDETIRIVNLIKDSVDIFHISSGGLLKSPMKPYPGYQIQFAEQIKTQCQVPTIAVGLITEYELVDEIVSNQRADLVALGRELLRNPYWPLRQSLVNKRVNIPFPEQYERARL